MRASSPHATAMAPGVRRACSRTRAASERPSGCRGSAGLPRRAAAGAFVRIHQGQARDAAARVRGHGDEELAQLRGQPPRRRGSEEVGRVQQPHVQAAGDLPHVEFEVETDRVEFGIDGRRRQSRQRERRERRLARRVVQAERHLRDRVALQIALGLQRFDQALERQVLVVVGVERHGAHAPDELREGRIAREVDLHCERVHEATDGCAPLGVAAPGDGRGDDHALGARVATQQDAARREQQHEGSPRILALAAQPRGNWRRERELHPRAAMGRYGGPRPVGRQGQHAWRVGERMQPVIPVARRARASASASRCQRA